MDQDKLQKVYDYLEVQGIHVTGKGEKNEEEQLSEKKRESVPLTREEEDYLKEYLKAFGFEENLRNRQDLLQACIHKEEGARESLIKACQRELADIARELNCREVLFADLLSEANTAFLTVLEELEYQEEKEELSELRLMEKVRRLVEEFLEDQTRQKREDNFLVEKVQNLEERVKALTDDDNVNPWSLHATHRHTTQSHRPPPCSMRPVCSPVLASCSSGSLYFLGDSAVSSYPTFAKRTLLRTSIPPLPLSRLQSRHILSFRHLQTLVQSPMCSLPS